jgi:hypothetical protein
MSSAGPGAGFSKSIALQLGSGDISLGSHLYTEPDDENFKASMSRWTDVNKETPTAIFKPATELDVEKIV